MQDVSNVQHLLTTNTGQYVSNICKKKIALFVHYLLTTNTGQGVSNICPEFTNCQH